MRSCEFVGNIATGLGGGVAADLLVDLTVTGCMIHGNVGGVGGGICVSAATGLVAGCDVRGNTGDFGGGVTLMSAYDVRIEDTEIAENDASFSGGGIYASDASFTIRNSAVTGNASMDEGGGLWLLSSSGFVERTAVVSNAAAGLGGGVYVEGGAIVLGSGSIEGNGTGIHVSVYGGGTVDARWNWWGHGSGPYHPLANPDGLGDAVSDGVLFDPWCATSSVEGMPGVVSSSWSAIKGMHR